MSNSTSQQPSQSLSGGRFLTFRLADTSFGVDIVRVQEIIGMQAITHVPRAPEWIRGIINLRGKVIPIVDMNKRFATATTDDTWKTCIVVIQLHGDQGTIPVGLVVDEISEVVTIDSTQLELPPQFQQADEENFIAAMGKIGREVIMLLNVDRVVSERDLMTAAVTEPSI